MSWMCLGWCLSYFEITMYFEMGKQIIYSENQTNYLKIKTTTLIVKTHNNFIIMVSNILYKKPLISLIQN